MGSAESNDRVAVILLADDSETDVLLARDALAAARPGCQVHVVEDGVQALAFLRGEGDQAGRVRPDLVLLDLNMPRMSGHQVLAEMKVDPDLATIPVVVLSTSRADDDIREAYRLHANCYVSKPIDITAFMRAVHDLCHFWLGTATLPPVVP